MGGWVAGGEWGSLPSPLGKAPGPGFTSAHTPSAQPDVQLTYSLAEDQSRRGVHDG